jgi:hypothetical protein
MRELGLGVDDVLRIIDADDVIERYVSRPGVLIHGVVRDVRVHVSVVEDPAGVTLITTVYAVDRLHFPDGRTRRRP